MDPSVRRSARLLIVDGRDRVLLLRFVFDAAIALRPYGWCTPGGGVHDGEALATAAAREAAEEVGLAVTPEQLGEPVAFTGGYADLGFTTGHFRDDFFLVRVGSHAVDTGGMEDLERSYHAGERWWSLPELADTEEIVFPYGLVPLLTDLIAGRRPDSPVALPWHHPLKGEPISGTGGEVRQPGHA
ncbi:MAG TPA: NUDIX domain-containing protein [Micromonosporaceae bacterium]|nr:NUDIX domain-containing protein [Micromonosporaceae bacterium]